MSELFHCFYSIVIVLFILIPDFECWQDYIKRIIPIILGAIAVGICLIVIVSFLVVREYRHRDYESL